MSRTKKIIIGVICGVIVVALVCVLAFVLPKNSDVKEAVVSTTTTTVSETTTIAETEAEADTTTAQASKKEPTACKITTTANKQKTHTYADYTKKPQKFDSTTTVVNAGTLKAEAVVQTQNRSAVDEYSDTIKAIDYENDKVVATVNGEAIYQSEVIEEKASLDLSIKNNLSQLNYNAKQEKAYIDEWSKTEDEILQQLIRNRVIVQKAKEAGIVLDKNYIDEQTSTYVNVIKQDEYYYKKLLSAFGITEEKYIEKTKKKFESTYYNSQFTAKFAETSGITDYTELNKKYEKHVDELVAKADIKYM